MYTVAGGVESGYGGDGGPATEALIMNPDIIAIDDAGVIYFPDNRNNVIRKLIPIEH